MEKVERLLIKVACITMFVALLVSSAVTTVSSQNASNGAAGTAVPCVCIGNITLVPNGTATGTIQIMHIDNVSAVQVNLTYDPNVVVVTDATNSDFRAFFVVNIFNGYTTITAIKGLPGLSSPVRVADITFKAMGNEGDSTPLNLKGVQVTYYDATKITIPTTSLDLNSGSFTITGTGAAAPAPEEVIIEEENILSTATAPSRTISPEVDSIFRLEEEKDIGISSITIRAKTSVSDVQVVVQKLSSKPSLLPSPPDSVYGYFNISATVVPGEDIESARIDFKVSKLWINTNEIDDTSIRLNRYVYTDTGDWESLQTTNIREDDPHYAYYFSETTGLSLFAITGRSKVTIPAPAVTPTPTSTSTPGPRPIPVPPPEKPTGTLIIIGIIVAVVVTGAAAYYFYTKKKT